MGLLLAQDALDLDQPGLLTSLLENPSALWVDPENYPEYETGLPARFKAAFLHESFLLAPLQRGDQPLGLIYADRLLGVNPLDKATFDRFRSAVLLMGKALDYLAAHAEQAAG